MRGEDGNRRSIKLFRCMQVTMFLAQKCGLQKNRNTVDAVVIQESRWRDELLESVAIKANREAAGGHRYNCARTDVAKDRHRKQLGFIERVILLWINSNIALSLFSFRLQKKCEKRTGRIHKIVAEASSIISSSSPSSLSSRLSSAIKLSLSSEYVLAGRSALG